MEFRGRVNWRSQVSRQTDGLRKSKANAKPRQISPEHDLRVLVVAPIGRDGVMICNLLTSRSIPCVNSQTAEMARIGDECGIGRRDFERRKCSAWPTSPSGQHRLLTSLPGLIFPLILLTVGGEVDHENQRKLFLLCSLSAT